MGVRDHIVDAGLLDAAYFDATCEAIDAWSRRPDAAFWFAMPWAEGVRRE